MPILFGWSPIIAIVEYRLFGVQVGLTLPKPLKLTVNHRIQD